VRAPRVRCLLAGALHLPACGCSLGGECLGQADEHLDVEWNLENGCTQAGQERVELPKILLAERAPERQLTSLASSR
jgi:hypothetical protein